MKEPKDWTEITLGQYREIIGVDARPLSYYGKVVVMLAAVCGVSQGTIKAMQPQDFKALVSRLEWLTKTAPEGVAVDRFELEGKLYHVPKDIGRRTIGEYADMDTFLLIHKDDEVIALASVLAVYCRKSGEPMFADEGEHSDRAQLFLSLPVTIALGLSGFFLANEQLCRFNLRLFMIQRTQILTETGTWLHSVRRMGGLRRFMHWPKTILVKWIRYKASLAGKSSLSLSSK